MNDQPTLILSLAGRSCKHCRRRLGRCRGAARLAISRVTVTEMTPAAGHLSQRRRDRPPRLAADGVTKRLLKGAVRWVGNDISVACPTETRCRYRTMRTALQPSSIDRVYIGCQRKLFLVLDTSVKWPNKMVVCRASERDSPIPGFLLCHEILEETKWEVQNLSFIFLIEMQFVSSACHSSFWRQQRSNDTYKLTSLHYRSAPLVRSVITYNMIACAGAGGLPNMGDRYGYDGYDMIHDRCSINN